GGTDRHAEREYAHQRERRTPQQLTDTQSDILHHLAHQLTTFHAMLPSQVALDTHRDRLAHIAEPPHRLRTRRLRRQPRSLQLRRTHLHMEADLRLHLRAHITRRPPPQPAPPHVAGSGASTRNTISAYRTHSAVSDRSRRRPSGVRR